MEAFHFLIEFCINMILNEESYQIARRAVRPDKEERYRTFGAFFAEWKMSNGVCI